MKSITKQVEERIKGWGRGAIFFHSDFADLGDSEATRKAVKRLCDAGKIRRYSRGIYYYPKIDTDFGFGEIPASELNVARAFADNKGISLYATDVAAQNLLGLSAQNQMKTIYLTNGPSVEIKHGGRVRIRLIHTSDNNLDKYSSEKMQLLNLALTGYHPKYIEEETRNAIKNVLSGIDDTNIDNDIKLMNTWKRNLISSLRLKHS